MVKVTPDYRDKWEYCNRKWNSDIFSVTFKRTMLKFTNDKPDKITLLTIISITV